MVQVDKRSHLVLFKQNQRNHDPYTSELQKAYKTDYLANRHNMMGTVSKLYVSNNTWIYVYINFFYKISTPIPTPESFNSNSNSNSGSFNSNSNSNSGKSLEYQLQLQLQEFQLQLQLQLQLRPISRISTPTPTPEVSTPIPTPTPELELELELNPTPTPTPELTPTLLLEYIHYSLYPPSPSYLERIYIALFLHSIMMDKHISIGHPLFIRHCLGEQLVYFLMFPNTECSLFLLLWWGRGQRISIFSAEESSFLMGNGEVHYIQKFSLHRFQLFSLRPSDTNNHVPL